MTYIFVFLYLHKQWKYTQELIKVVTWRIGKSGVDREGMGLNINLDLLLYF